MADINISMQDYNPGGTAQYNGWMPNTFSEELEAVATSIAANGTADIPADFKDHKTVFLVKAAAAANITFKAGNTDGAANKVVREAPAGLSLIWLESAPFVDKETGKITVETDAAIKIVGYEMR